MTPTGGRRFLRDNAFLVAAVVLPVAVVAFFLLATAIPRMRVPPPAYDLILRADRPYEPAQAQYSVEFEVRDDAVVAVIRTVPVNTYLPRPALLLFDHRTLELREIPLQLPAVAEGDPVRTLTIEALSGRRIVSRAKAPDGYEFDARTDRGPGIVGELFGMRRHDRRATLVKDGRVIPLTLPAGYQHSYGLHPVGWVVEP